VGLGLALSKYMQLVNIFSAFELQVTSFILPIWPVHDSEPRFEDLPVVLEHFVPKLFGLLGFLLNVGMVQDNTQDAQPFFFLDSQFRRCGFLLTIGR